MADKINKLVRIVNIPNLTSNSDGVIATGLSADTIVVRATYGNYMLFPFASSGKLKYVVGDTTSDKMFKAVHNTTYDLSMTILGGGNLQIIPRALWRRCAA